MDTVIVFDTVRVVDTVMHAVNTANTGLSTDTITIFVTFAGGFLIMIIFLFRMSERISKVETEIKVLSNKFDGTKEKTDKTEEKIIAVEKEVAGIKVNIDYLMRFMDKFISNKEINEKDRNLVTHQ